jgi:dihydrofolate reductase
MSSRKIIVYIATSADGYIARDDDSVDWLNRAHAAGDYGMADFRASVDAIVYGRKTYEFGISHGVKFDAATKHYVFTHEPQARAAPNVTFVNERVDVFANRLRAAPGKDIWLMGGGSLIGSFADADQVDEFIIHVIPVLIGAGIPLLKPHRRTLPLTLRSTRQFSDGVVRLHYAMARGATQR